MKLLGVDISARALLEHIEDRLVARGLGRLAPPEERPIQLEGAEPRVDPHAFHLAALEEHMDPTRGLPLETHRTGLPRLALYAKWAYRRTCQVFINETLARQRLFNAQVFDAYVQLSAEVKRLRESVEGERPSKAVKPRRRKSSKPRGSL